MFFLLLFAWMISLFGLICSAVMAISVASVIKDGDMPKLRFIVATPLLLTASICGSFGFFPW